MYRLAKLKRLYSFNSPGVTAPYFSQPSKYTCSFCKHNFSPKPLNEDPIDENIRICDSGSELESDDISDDFQTDNHLISSENEEEIAKQDEDVSLLNDVGQSVKRARIVVVTDSSSNQTKAPVSKLKPKDLSQLIKQPDINLGQLYTLKKATSQAVALQDTTLQETENEVVSSIATEPSFSYKKPVFEKLSPNFLSTLKELDILKNSKDELVKDPELLQTINGSIDDIELKSEFMKDLDKGIIEHSELEDTDHGLSLELESGCHSSALDDGCHSNSLELDTVEFDESSIETMSTVVPVPQTSAKENSVKKTSKEPKHKTSFKLRQKELTAKVKLSDLEKAAKEECLYRNLKSYLEVCVNCGLQNRAFFSLLFYHSRSKHSKFTSAANEIKLFNIILHGFARKGNIYKIKELLQILHKDNIPLSPQSFAGVFECIGRLPESSENEKLLREYVKEMTKMNLTFNDVMQRSTFLSDQREMALRAISIIDPDFIYTDDMPDTCYSCSLMQELNSEEGNAFKSPAEGLMSKTELQQLAKEQLQTELNNYVHVKTIEKRSEPNETILYYREKLQETQKEWRRTIQESYYRDVKTLRAQHNFRAYRNINLYPYLKVLDPQDYIEIIMQEIRKLAEGSETYSPTTHQLYRNLGNKVRSRYEVKFKSNSGILDKVGRLYEEYCDWYLNPEEYSSECKNTREKWQHLIHENQEGSDVSIEEISWPGSVLIAVGRFLYNIIMKDIKIDVNIAKTNSKTQHLLPAFYTLFRSQGRTLKEEVKPHPILARLFRGAAQEDLVFEVTTVPMLCPPLPWTSINSGGYLVAKAGLIRLHQQAIQQWQLLNKTPRQQLYPSLDSLNQLGSIPWTVNEPVLNVVIEVFNNGGSQRLDIPEPPSSCPPPSPVTQEMTKVERFQAYRERLALRRRKAEMYSLWCDALYRLSLANHGRMWWATSEEPWQTLACCMAIAEAVKSGDPENYICHFPVHQDGSCNGLQHYAALGRDQAGAESVNLTPAECPQDVYSCVAAMVERERSKDAALGVKVAQVLDGYVLRKVIKQTVMTTVYGVTRYGARLQIARQLKDIENFPKEYVWQGSTYLVGKTFESLQEMFTSTKEIQDWFTECARLISQVCAQNVEWVTPLGLPIVQPYSRASKKLEIQTYAKKIKEHYSLDMYERPNVMKQKNAFPPNFIHSLDSSHMMLTSLFCERAGITFVSVHDCFWTHPSSIDIMNEVCRKQFVALHSQPILEDLSEFLTQKFSYREGEFTNDGSVVDMTKRKLNRILTKLPSKGDLDLHNVLDSVYFFS
ncbi:hypothetical protein C0J52_13214 [Blattella germanica]|nr:hypothetical protein C0J52_13214 [Blattella germanica]